MSHDEVAGYAVLAGYGLVVVAMVRAVGFKRVLLGALGLVTVAFALAIGSLRAFTTRR